MKQVLKHITPIVAMGALMGCSTALDFDLRNTVGGKLDTSAAARSATLSRPKPDANGVISYPKFDVAIARRGDRLTDVASRIGAKASDLGRYNGIAVDAPL
ncbi:MAG: peptidase M23, partial [Planktomarina sp.]